MKVLVFADNHFCERYSLINGYGTKYSTRIENQLQSIAWVESQALEHKCDFVVCLGDFFDKPQLTDQELTALREIKWADIPHYFLVGNHESELNDLQYSSTKALESSELLHVVSTPELWTDLDHDCEFGFLPYITERDRKPLTEYFPKLSSKHRIIFTHNDLKGVQLGPVVSRTGFEPDAFDEIGSLCLNGHLHNGQAVTKTVINVGNLTGKDLGENASKYSHNIVLVDTNTLQLTYIENPYAFNFYHINIESEADIKQLDKLKSNAVLSIHCTKKLVTTVKDKLQKLSPNHIIEYRLTIVQVDSTGTDQEFALDSLTVDHLSKFAECCHEKLGNSAILEMELAEVLK